MIDFYPCFRPLLMAMEPERAHRLALLALRAGLAPSCQNNAPALRTTLWGREFRNPLGLAAGFDKDAEVIAPLFGMGFGFVEVGSVTPLPQAGNPRPRVFRDIANQSVVNRMGFPGKGLEAFVKNIRDFRQRHPETPGILGVNIGINKGTASPFDDYRRCMEALSSLAGYMTINVSSPNTAGLRSLQARDELDNLLSRLMPQKQAPVLLKIAPDLNAEERADIAALALRYRIDGLVISNTTVMRPPSLQHDLKNEKGGLSGVLLKTLATESIRDFFQRTEGRLLIVGVGGVSSAEDAYDKIRAGASLVQLYTALLYQGPALIARILDGLTQLLRQDGFQHVFDAVGTGNVKPKTVI